MYLSKCLKPHRREPIHVQAGRGDPVVLRHPIELEVGGAPFKPDARRVVVKAGEIMPGRLDVVLDPPMLLVCWGRILQQGWAVANEPSEREMWCTVGVERRLWRWADHWGRWW